MEGADFIICGAWFLVKGLLDSYRAPFIVILGWESPVELSVRPYQACAHNTLIRRSILSMMDVRRHFTAEAYRVALVTVWVGDVSELQL